MLRFENSTKPWFGPRKRARELLAARTRVAPLAEACAALQRLAGEAAGGLEFVRFIDFTHTGERFRYTIAVVWTTSDPDLRDLLYSVGAAFVKETGWYPLPQGHRLASRRSERELRAALGDKRLLHGVLNGRLESITNAVGADGGCSVRIVAGEHSVLLDAGLRGKLTPLATDRAVLLSHFHLDHAGGVVDGATGSLPIGMSLGTARILIDRSASIASRAVALEPEVPVELGPGIVLRSFPVPHAPGAVGFELTDPDSAVVFTGDFCARSARHDFLPAMRGRLGRLGNRRKWLLLDATMAGRPFGASLDTPAQSLLTGYPNLTDIVLVGDAGEQLLYAYMDLFHYAKDSALRTGCSYLLSPSLRSLFEIVHSSFMLHHTEQIDPFVLGQYGVTMSSWGESRWLFWLDQLTKVPTETRRIWLVGRDEIEGVKCSGETGVVFVGRGEDGMEQFGPGAVKLDLDTSPWTLHSSEDSLEEAVRTLSVSSEVVLFHNFPGRLRQFIKRRGLRARALDDHPVLLR